MKNKKLIIAVVLLILVVSGFSLDIAGFSFSTKYFNTSIEAYNSENSEYELREEIASAKIDKIQVSLCKTEGEEYVITPFKVKDSRYYSLSHIDVLYEVEIIDDDIGESFYRIDGKKVYYDLIEAENIESYNNLYEDISFSERVNFDNGKSFVIAVYYK